MTIRCIVVCSVLSLVGGCSEEQESLHEHDHFVPDHWPSGVGDAADKIAERVRILVDSSDTSSASHTAARQELAELIGWVPEIAADTDLTEQDWIPIYELSESLRKQMDARENGVEQLQPDLSELREKLRDAENKLSQTTD